MTNDTVSVAVVGAGPAGMSLALFLAKQGVDCVVVEQGHEVVDHPRAHVINVRTMELMKNLGLDEAIQTARLPDRAVERVVWTRSLTEQPIVTLDAGAVTGRREMRQMASASAWASIAQSHVDQVLRSELERRGIPILLGHQVTGVTQNDEFAEITATADGATSRIRSRFVVGADGSRSVVRDAAGISMRGPTELASLVGIYFETIQEGGLGIDPRMLSVLMNPRVPGTIISVDGVSRWMLHVRMPELDNGSHSEAKRILSAATGLPDAALRVISMGPWSMSAQVAEQFRSGRIFLIGDAAHRFPPTGGYGLNSGVQDAHNLAWKLKLVLDGTAGDALLDTYDTERRQVANENTAWSVGNATDAISFGQGLVGATASIERGGQEAEQTLELLRADIQAHRSHFDSLGMDLGFQYQQGALVPELAAPTGPVSDDYNYHPVARPGARAPHVCLEGEHGPLSSAQLFLGAFSLVIPPGGTAWLPLADALGAERGVTIQDVIVGPDAPWRDPSGRWLDLYGITSEGALLVRPDGHVAWRSIGLPGDEGRARLAHAFEAVTGGRPTPTRAGKQSSKV